MFSPSACVGVRWGQGKGKLEESETITRLGGEIRQRQITLFYIGFSPICWGFEPLRALVLGLLMMIIHILIFAIPFLHVVASKAEKALSEVLT